VKYRITKEKSVLGTLAFFPSHNASGANQSAYRGYKGCLCTSTGSRSIKLIIHIVLVFGKLPPVLIDVRHGLIVPLHFM
jgi:hypothetical protein